jgi:hypothetical protein|tara:strand:- start:1020 stop:1682 length:663 start_codon:yes stop_codon:yes gene_type:complete
MNFNELMQRMRELDTTDAPVTEMPVPMPQAPMTAPEGKDKARMNVNISAEGDAIEDVLKLMTKVNPDMINQPEKPEMPDMPDMTIAMPKPINKLIPDFDGDNDDKPGGDMDMDMDKDDHDADHDMIKGLDKDDDGDHDMDDHDAEKKDKEEAYANEPDEDHRDIDYMQNKLAGGMNRPKGTHPKVADGDNPMKKVKEGDDLRAQIKAELAQRLAEAKGEK